VITRNRSLGALDHQRRDLHSIKLSYLTEDRAASSINRVAVRNASPLQDIDGVLALVEEDTLRPVLDGDAEEVVEGPQVLHREIPLKGDDRVL
jgi:hypothetical protein